MISDSDSELDEDGDLGFSKCRNNRRKTCKSGATGNIPRQKRKQAKVKKKSCKAPLLDPFNWDDLFPKHDNENEALSSPSAGATCADQSQDRRTARDYLLSRHVTNNYNSNCNRRYGVFDRRKNVAKRPSYGCYTNYGRRFSQDPEERNTDKRARLNRHEFGCHGDTSSGQPTNRGASRCPGPSNYGNRRDNLDTRNGRNHLNNRRPVSGNHSNNCEKVTHVNLQTYDDIINSCTQRNNELTAALRCTVNLPPLNGIATTQANNSFCGNQVSLGNNIYTSTFQLTSSCSSLASSYQQQCFCDSSLHISLRCHQCQANWLANPDWRSRRSLLAPSSSDSQESERALSIDTKMWHTPTPPPPYDEALEAPERVHRIELNDEVSYCSTEMENFDFPVRK